MSSSWSWWNIWLFSGRINRLRLLIVILACLFYVILIDSSGITRVNRDLAFAIALPALYLILATSVQRLHDLGYTGWFILLYLIPGLNMILIIALPCLRGNSGANKYGPDLLPPRPSSPSDSSTDSKSFGLGKMIHMIYTIVRFFS